MTTRIPIDTVETEAFAMDYFKFGRGEEALVIIPGLSIQSVMLSADAIAHSYRLLADDFTIYVLGGRKTLPAEYPVRDMAHDTAAALRALDLRQTCVLGASLGGMVAMSMAIEQPHLVRKLVLCSTTARMTDPLSQTLEQWVRLAKAGDATDLYLAFGEALYPHDMFEQLRSLLIETSKNVTSEELDRFIVLAKSIEGFDITDELEKISCPTLLVGSASDKVLGAETTKQIAEHLGEQADCTLHVYDGYGHAAYDTAPDFKERVLRFLKPRS